jgi:N-methylhydantoinase B
MIDSTLDPISLTVLNSALSGVAEEMGALLIRASYSSNIKERRDCSTALFDGRGVMVAQAEHIPVHLGAMPESVAAVINCDPMPGDVFVLNHPFQGGTHLPDITLVSPVVHGGRIVAYAVTRAHHSDIGGVAPGSMPSASENLYQEGLIIPPVRLVRAGESVDEVLEIILANSRTPDLRRGDLRAQLAANRLGERRLVELIELRTEQVLLSAFEEIVSYAERRARATIVALDDGDYIASSEIEGDGFSDADVPIEVRVSVAGDSLAIDFTGTAPAVRGNVNCPLPVTRSACYFALRVLMPQGVPLNAGAYRPVQIVAPEGSLVNARSPSAVVAGNVETSQRIADTVLDAFAQAGDLPAHGQGTMNNLVIGGRGWTYYETLGGGQGASRHGAGASGIHVGMTNTFNTPIEALELEFPLRVERYELEYGSGGAGLHRGGDGLVRTVRALEPATMSIISDRRRHRPRGSHGGEAGRPGSTEVNGAKLPAKATRPLTEGDVVSVTTPGGGGWGRPRSNSS